MSLSLLSPLPDLRVENEALRRDLFARNRQLAEAEEELRQERQKNAAVESGVQNLRAILGPLFNGLKQIYGEMDAMGPAGSGVTDPRKSAIWESWKAKLPSGESKAIDALLLHGTMTTAQLRIHVGCASRTAQNIAAALKSKGLIVKNGAQISLKEL